MEEGREKESVFVKQFLLVFDLGQFLGNLYHGSIPSSLSLILSHTCCLPSVSAFMSSASGQRLCMSVMQRHVITMTSYSALPHPLDITVCPPLPGPERE